MYCFSHKKNSMVHIFKEELDLQDSGENTKTATEVVARFVLSAYCLCLSVAVTLSVPPCTSPTLTLALLVA